MRIPRVHVDEPLRAGATVLLPEQAGEHVARVLRMERGQPLILFNGDGREYDAELATLAKRAVTAEVTGVREVSRESPLSLTLVQGIARGEKMDWILQKATELGVMRIAPVMSERTEVKLDEERAERRMAHWTQIIAMACEQCGRTELPRLDPPQKLTAFLVQLGDDAAARLALLPDGEISLRALGQVSQGGAGFSLRDLPQGAVLAVGPEGGFSDHDESALRQAGFAGLRLGPRILRTETAGIAALAALQAIAGDLA